MKPTILRKSLETTNEHGARCLAAAFAIGGPLINGTIEISLAPNDDVEDTAAVAALQKKMHEILTALAEKTKAWAT